MSKQKARTNALKTSAPRHKDPAKTSADTPETNGVAKAAGTAAANGHIPAMAPAGADRNAEIAEKIKELVRLAQEQGYLTYNDINDALPDNMISREELDEIYIKLRNLEIEIVDQAEVDRVKAARTGRRGRQDPAGYSRRSGADVSQADGPGAAADARTGSGDFQAHRGRRERSQAHHLQFWFRRQGTHRAGGKARFPNRPRNASTA